MLASEPGPDRLRLWSNRIVKSDRSSRPRLQQTRSGGQTLARNDRESSPAGHTLAHTAGGVIAQGAKRSIQHDRACGSKNSICPPAWIVHLCVMDWALIVQPRCFRLSTIVNIVISIISLIGSFVVISVYLLYCNRCCLASEPGTGRGWLRSNRQLGSHWSGRAWLQSQR
jgi:hypothetical protein